MASASVDEKLSALGLERTIDFALHFPLRFEDYSQITSIAVVQAGRWAQVQGVVIEVQNLPRPARGGRKGGITINAKLQDDSGAVINLRFLYAYPGLSQRLKAGTRLRAAGEVKHRLRAGFEIIHPKLFEPQTDNVGSTFHAEGVLTPVYSTVQGLAQGLLRRRIAKVLHLDLLAETLPQVLLQSHGLAPFFDSIKKLHEAQLPKRALGHDTEDHPAWRRIKFDEALAQQLVMLKLREISPRFTAYPCPEVDNGIAQRLLNSLPFTLTAGQQRAWSEIREDLSRGCAMQRLLQGDVGCGKTIVAALAAAQVIDNGGQVAFMAPTELLSQQHAQKIMAWFVPLGVNVASLASDMPAAQKRKVLAGIADGSIAIVVGTHALIQAAVHFNCLRLAVVDEQHRFGVTQRLSLKQKAAGADSLQMAHLLMMSATPIPRTLAMTYLSDLDVTVIPDLPPGRLPVVTKLVDQARRDEVVAAVADALDQGRQCYWVCPLVEESETLGLSAAQETYALLQSCLPHVEIGLMHGRLSAIEKADIMRNFSAGKLRLLVATTVIEVGVDVPNASILVVEHAERFGLAQLHQLRGRVGRGSHDSTCVLLYGTPLSQSAKARLRAMKETQDGFEIARRDLHIRGPGEFLGLRQSGELMLRFVDIEQDEDLVALARVSASLLLKDYPEHAAAHLERWLPINQAFLGT